jgi:hypothetical protein
MVRSVPNSDRNSIQPTTHSRQPLLPPDPQFCTGPSAFNKIRALVNFRAGCLPLWIKVFRRSRSSALSFTTYLFTAISFATTNRLRRYVTEPSIRTSYQMSMTWPTRPICDDVLSPIPRPCADSVFFPCDPQPLGDMLSAKQQENNRGSSSREYL